MTEKPFASIPVYDRDEKKTKKVKSKKSKDEIQKDNKEEGANN